MSSFEEFLRPSGSEKDTLAGRTSLDAFDRGISLSSDENIAPAGSEIELHDGMMPVSRLIVIEDADYLGHIRQAYLRRMMEKVRKVLASEDFESLSNYANTRYGASMRASPLGGARHTQYNAAGAAQPRHMANGSYGASGSDGF